MADRTPRRVRLDTPLLERSSRRPHYDPDAFGRVSEQIARFLGTARFLVYMTAFIAVWIGINVTPYAFDPYTFTFLTLLLSLQASYAAPLILLAQNRQADRDRVSLEEDRATSQRLQADVEYLTREVASLRQALGEVATREYLRDQLREMTDELVERTAPPEPAAEAVSETPAAPSTPGKSKREDRERRDDRERRAERKKRRILREQESTVLHGLGEPFVGGDEDG